MVTDYLLIITNKELSAGNGATLAEIYPAGTLAPPSEIALEHLPLDHIYVVSIEDFERLMAGARRGQVDLPTFMADCVVRDRDPSTSRFYFEHHLDKHGVPRGYSAAVEDAYLAAMARVASVTSRFAAASHQNQVA